MTNPQEWAWARNKQAQSAPGLIPTCGNTGSAPE